jgi:hypothetical protein
MVFHGRAMISDFLLRLFVLLLGAVDGVNQAPAFPPPVLGAIFRGRVYSVLCRPQQPGTTSLTAYLQSLPLYPDLGSSQAQEAIPTGPLGGRSAYLRWHLAFGALWIHDGEPNPKDTLYLSMRIPWEDLPYLDPARDAQAKTFFENEYGRGWHWRHEWATGHPHRELCDQWEVRFGLGGTEPDRVYFDAAPIATDRTLMFGIVKGKMTIFEGVAQWDNFKELVRWKLLQQIDAPFHEAFTTFVQRNHYFFLTTSGRLYHSPPATRGKRTIEGLWTDPRRPFAAAISDVDGERVFLFLAPKDADGRPVRGGYGGYALLGPKLSFWLYDSEGLPGSGADLLKRVLGYARILGADGRLKAPRQRNP